MMHPAVHGFGRDANAVKGKRVERDLLRRVLQLAHPYRKQLIGFVTKILNEFRAIEKIVGGHRCCGSS